MALAVDPAEADRWARDGLVVRRAVLDPVVVDGLRATHAALVEAAPHARASGLLAGPATPAGLDPSWLAAVEDPGLTGFGEAVLGGPVRLFSTCWITKAAEASRPARWHQDGPAWRVDPEAVATVWVALDDADAGNGCLRVAPGSHRRGPLPHDRDDDRLATELFPVGVDADEAAAADAAAVDVVLRAGDASAHHPHLVHGSGPNSSARARRALVVRYERRGGGPDRAAGTG